MTPLDKAVLEKKVAYMRQALQGIEEILTLGLAAYRRELLLQAAMERQLERLVEAAVDAAVHILRARFKTSPESYRDAFLALGRHGVITPELAGQLAPAAGLRNLIAHQYETIDQEKVWAAAHLAMQRFPTLMEALRAQAKEA